MRVFLLLIAAVLASTSNSDASNANEIVVSFSVFFLRLNIFQEMQMKYEYVTRFWDRVWQCLSPLIILALLNFIKKSL